MITLSSLDLGCHLGGERLKKQGKKQAAAAPFGNGVNLTRLVAPLATDS